MELMLEPIASIEGAEAEHYLECLMDRDTLSSMAQDPAQAQAYAALASRIEKQGQAIHYYGLALRWVSQGRTDFHTFRRSIAAQLAIEGPSAFGCQSLRDVSEKTDIPPGSLSRLVERFRREVMDL